MISNSLTDLFQQLYTHYGKQYWWPANSLLEMMVGALLTQNTAWDNVCKTMKILKEKGILNLNNLLNTPQNQLESYIKPCGYYKNKTRRLIQFLHWLNNETSGEPSKLFLRNMMLLRKQLLNLEGFGYETVDSILLYGGNYPIFVIDAYTMRIFKRHGLIIGDESYEELRMFVEDQLPRDYLIYQEFHALIVKVGSEKCHKAPDCDSCPLSSYRSLIIE